MKKSPKGSFNWYQEQLNKYNFQLLEKSNIAYYEIEYTFNGIYVKKTFNTPGEMFSFLSSQLREFKLSKDLGI
jgi:hypothetical protein